MALSLCALSRTFHLSSMILTLITSMLLAPLARALIIPSTFPELWDVKDDQSSTTHVIQNFNAIIDDEDAGGWNISRKLFAELEELARIVDISYCVGTTGIQKPFTCLGRCSDFEGFELVETWNTGPLMSDSCGYVAIDNSRPKFGGNGDGRIIVAFRGTYSIASTIADLSTIPQEYVPYPTDPDGDDGENQDQSRHRSWLPSWWPSKGRLGRIFDVRKRSEEKPECQNCTVHYGFYTSYLNTRPILLPLLESLRQTYPTYDLHLVGHSLGGAVALLSALEYETLGWEPTVTTYGEPRVGNLEFRKFVDDIFQLDESSPDSTQRGRYRRMTHVEDPVPLLPLTEWGYLPHAGEVFISKQALPPALDDVRQCDGDEDMECSAGHDSSLEPAAMAYLSDLDEEMIFSLASEDVDGSRHTDLRKRGFDLGLSSRYKLWQLFFAHRDYFWRLGLCVPGGDPLDRDWNWGRGGKNRYDGIITDTE